MKIAVTGHRPEEFGGGFVENNVHEWLGLMAEFLSTDDRFGSVMDEGLTGMSRGVDLWWARAVLHRRVPLTAYVPFWEQARSWNETDRNEWGQVIGACRDVVVTGRSEPYHAGLYHARNKAMVDAADMVLVVCGEKTSGGTYSTWQYASNSEKTWIRYNPWDNSVTGSDDVKEAFV